MKLKGLTCTCIFNQISWRCQHILTSSPIVIQIRIIIPSGRQRELCRNDLLLNLLGLVWSKQYIIFLFKHLEDVLLLTFLQYVSISMFTFFSVYNLIIMLYFFRVYFLVFKQDVLSTYYMSSFILSIIYLYLLSVIIINIQLEKNIPSRRIIILIPLCKMSF